MTDILIEADEISTFLNLDKAWRSQLAPEQLARIGEYQRAWLPQ